MLKELSGEISKRDETKKKVESNPREKCEYRRDGERMYRALKKLRQKTHRVRLEQERIWI